MSKYSTIFDKSKYNYLENLNAETAISENVILEDVSIELSEGYIYDYLVDDVLDRDVYYAML